MRIGQHDLNQKSRFNLNLITKSPWTQYMVNGKPTNDSQLQILSFHQNIYRIFYFVYSLADYSSFDIMKYYSRVDLLHIITWIVAAAKSVSAATIDQPITSELKSLRIHVYISTVRCLPTITWFTVTYVYVTFICDHYHTYDQKIHDTCFSSEVSRTFACGIIGSIGSRLDYCNAVLYGTHRVTLSMLYNVFKTTWPESSCNCRDDLYSRTTASSTALVAHRIQNCIWAGFTDVQNPQSISFTLPKRPAHSSRHYSGAQRV